MLDPVRLKKYFINGLKILIVIEFLTALSLGVSGQGWERMGFDLVIAGVIYIAWDRIREVIPKKKEEYKRKMESPGGEIKVWDALVFSLLWSDEIYDGIPGDRNRLVVISYTLIAIGVVASYLEIGPGMMPLVVTGALVLGAVNLLAWVVSTERGEKETLQTELKLARDVQLSLMPKEHPVVEGFDIAGRSTPAQEVGGDHFAYSDLSANDGMFGISVFDVSGKGMQAAMSAVFTSGALVNESMRTSSPAETLVRLNRTIHSHSKRGHFVAFLLASLNVKRKTLSFANAGQTKPLLCSNGTVQWLDGCGVNFPLGMVEVSEYQDRSVQLHSGDTVLFMTDGFTEAMNIAKEQFGPERMEELVKSAMSGTTSAVGIINSVEIEVRRFMQSAPQHDDMTMVVVRVL